MNVTLQWFKDHELLLKLINKCGDGLGSECELLYVHVC